MDAVWKNISIDNYFSSATGEENRITTVWKWEPKFYSDTKARKCIIDSANEWHSTYMSDSFVPRYKDGKSPQDPDAEIFTLSEYYPNATIEEKGKGTDAVNDSNSILQVTTTYETISRTRLIVDGLKRSLGIMNKISDSQEFRPVTILECYGPSVSEIFYGDFPQVLKRTS
jgi:hypothetical protein